MLRRLRFIVVLVVIGVIAVGTINIMKLLKEPSHDIEAFVPDIEEDEDSAVIEEKDMEVYKYTMDDLNFRTGPGTNHEIILTIPKGERVMVTGHNNGWDKLLYDDIIGYSAAEYLVDFIEEDLDDEDDELEIVVSPETMKIVNGILLVNKEYALPMGYDPGEDPEALEYLNKMFDACLEETGNQLIAYSGYRTYEYQRNLFNGYVNKNGYDEAVMYSAKPRHSEHETGLAYDIGGSNQSYWLEEEFEDTEEGIWLRENAHRFGYILRYPKGKTDITGYIYEPWHFRYIGVEDATNIHEMNITLEEYLLGDN